MKCIFRQCLLAILVLGVFIAVSAFAADKPVKMSGGGGFPLTPTVTAMWGAVDEVDVPGKTPLSFIVYFSGAKGWHEREWKSELGMNKDPFLIEFSSDLIKLRIVVNRSTRILTIYDHQIDLTKNNLILVNNADQPGREVVAEMGLIDLKIPANDNPAVWVVNQNKDLQKKLNIS